MSIHSVPAFSGRRVTESCRPDPAVARQQRWPGRREYRSIIRLAPYGEHNFMSQPASKRRKRFAAAKALPDAGFARDLHRPGRGHGAGAGPILILWYFHSEQRPELAWENPGWVNDEHASVVEIASGVSA